MLELSRIRIDGGTQQRAHIDDAVVDEYAQAMKSGASFPPVVVFYDGTTYWLADGFHRYLAAKRAGLEAICEKVETGSQRDAILYSLGANGRHGLRRTNADKRKAVETMLRDPEWSKWSDNEIARQCAVNQTTVSAHRRSLAENLSDSTGATRKYTTKHGTEAVMNTTNIGKSRTSAPDADDAPDDDYGPDAAEVAESTDALIARNAELEGLLAGNDAATRVMDLTKVIAGLNTRINGLLAENAALKRKLVYWRNRAGGR